MLKLIGFPTIVVSSVGLVASLLIILAALTGWRDSGAVVSIAMCLIIVISMLVMILVTNSGFENLSQRQVMKLVQESCPKWMQVGGKGLVLVGVLAFLAAAIENGMAQASDFEGFPALFLGGFGTVIHSQAIVSIYGAMQLQENLARSQCKYGHQIPLGAKFCPECGEKASPDSQPI